MAIIYAYSGAVGANAGTSWADAYTSAATAYNAWTVGDEVWVADDHTESVTGTHNIGATNSSINNNIVIYRMNRATNTYSPTTGSDTRQYNLTSSGADLRFSDGSLDLYGLMAGFFFAAFDNISLRYSNCHQNMIDCYFELNDSGSRFELGNAGSQIGSTYTTFLRCTFDWTVSGGQLRQEGNVIRMTDCVFKGSADPNGLFRVADEQDTQVYIVGGDFSQMTSMPVLVNVDDGDPETSSVWHFIACKLPAGQVIHTDEFASDGCFIYLHNSSDGNKTYVSARYGLRGDVEIDLTTFYNGANHYIDIDGARSLSHKMTIKANTTLANGLASLEIYGRFAGTGAKTLSLEILENFTTALTKRECWLEVMYLGELDSTRWISAEDREMAGLTFTDLSAGAGILKWLIPPVGARSVKVSTTINVVKAGSYRAVLHVAKYEAGKQVNYNPKIDIT